MQLEMYRDKPIKRNNSRSRRVEHRDRQNKRSDGLYDCSGCRRAGTMFEDVSNGHWVCTACGLCSRTGVYGDSVDFPSRCVESDAAVYKRVIYFNERMSAFVFSEPGIHSAVRDDIVRSFHAFLGTERGRHFDHRRSQLALRLGKEEFKDILVAARAPTKKYLEKWRSVCAWLQEGHLVPPRPSRSTIDALKALFASVDRAWASEEVRLGRRNMIKGNFIIRHLLIMEGGAEMYETYVFEFPLEGSQLNNAERWGCICRACGWEIRIPVTVRVV